MCSNPELLVKLQLYLSIAAPVITTLSGFLALFTKTTAKRYITVNNRRRQQNYFTIWAWCSLAGLLFGVSVSVWYIFNQKSLDQIYNCQKEEQDKAYNLKIEKANEQLSKANEVLSYLHLFSDKAVGDFKNITSLQKQNLYRQSGLLTNTEIQLHPMQPLEITIEMGLQMDDKVSESIRQQFAEINKDQKQLPNFVKFKSKGTIKVGQHSVTDIKLFPNGTKNPYFNLETQILKLLPVVYLNFLKDKKPKINPSEVFTGSEFTTDTSLMLALDTDYNIEERVRYDRTIDLEFLFFPERNHLFFAITITPNYTVSKFSPLRSLWEIKNGSLQFQFGDSDGVISYLNGIFIKCGTPAPERYSRKLSGLLPIILEDTNIYIVSIKSIIENLNPAEEYLRTFIFAEDFY